jgi:hypothetical protein
VPSAARTRRVTRAILPVRLAALRAVGIGI